jgi:hypothetical protein
MGPDLPCKGDAKNKRSFAVVWVADHDLMRDHYGIR